MKNQIGSIDILAMAVMLLLTGAITLWVLSKSNLYLKHQYLQRQQLCFKTFLNNGRELIKKIEKVNSIIKSIKTVSILSSFLGLSATVIQKIGTKGIQKILFLMQENYKNNFFIQIQKMKKNKCHFSLSTYGTPYQLKGIFLKRDHKGIALKRNNYQGYFSKKNFLFTYKLTPNQKEKFNVKFIKK